MYLPAYFRQPALIGISLLLAWPAAALAQGAYVFTKIIDGDTPRPDGQGNFYIGSPDIYPSLSGETVLFQDITNGANSLWVASAAGGTQGLLKLADFSTPVPGGAGTFTRFDNQTARVQDGIVLFEGLDSTTTDTTHGGLYTVPAAGGVIRKVFDYHTTAPESGDPFIQSNANNQITDGVNNGDYDLENGVIAFHAITSANADGIYTIHPDGTALTLLANRSYDATAPPYPVNQYYSVAFHGGTAVFNGATVFGGYGIFSAPNGGPSVPGAIATPGTPLPGSTSPGQTVYYETSNEAGFNRFDHVTGSLIFAAHDASGDNGLYSIPSGGILTKVVDNQTPLPGSSTPASAFDGAPFSADSGQVAFITPGDSAAIYVTNADGGYTRVIGVGDVLDGITLTGLDLGAFALSGGRIAFGAGSYLQGHDGDARYGAIFVATPLAESADLSLSMRTSADMVAAGQEVTYTLSVVNLGPAAASAVQITDTLPAGAAFVSVTGGGAAAAGGVVTLNAGPLAAGASASFVLVAKAETVGALTNSAIVSGPLADGNLSNNAAQSVVDSLETPAVTIAATGKGEAIRGGVDGKLVVRRKGELKTALTVFYEERGSALAGVDYKRLSGKVSLPVGVAQAKITIKATNDKKADSDSTATIRLLPSKDGSYKLGSEIKAKIKVID